MDDFEIGMSYLGILHYPPLSCIPEHGTSPGTCARRWRSMATRYALLARRALYISESATGSGSKAR
jgi:hypothetical protein